MFKSYHDLTQHFKNQKNVGSHRFLRHAAAKILHHIVHPVWMKTERDQIVEIQQNMKTMLKRKKMYPQHLTKFWVSSLNSRVVAFF